MKKLFIIPLIFLAGCAYNDPNRFLGSLDPHTLALIEKPEADPHPGWAKLQGPTYSHLYAAPAYGPAYGSWGPK